MESRSNQSSNRNTGGKIPRRPGQKLFLYTQVAICVMQRLCVQSTWLELLKLIRRLLQVPHAMDDRTMGLVVQSELFRESSLHEQFHARVLNRN